MDCIALYRIAILLHIDILWQRYTECTGCAVKSLSYCVLQMFTMLGIKIQWNSFKWCPFCYSLNSDPKSWKIMDYRVRFLAKMWPTIKSTFRTSFERLFHTDHNGTIPSFIPHSHAKIWCVFHLTFWIHGVGISPNFWAMYYARYLGLGMRYEAGICTIVISMNRFLKIMMSILL